MNRPEVRRQQDPDLPPETPAGPPDPKDDPTPAILQGYKPFPKHLRRSAPLLLPLTGFLQPKRTAVLVVHGIGAQKPYQILDQFARGLKQFFATQSANPANPPTQEIKLRQHGANANTGEKDWTQAFARVRPSPGDPWFIDVYEYYWAPVITGKVSALESLKFLILAGLSPFQYLRDNLIIIDRAHPRKYAGKKFLWMIHSFLRELCRMFFIFIPTIAICLGLYWLLSTPISTLFAGHGDALKSIGPLLKQPELTPWSAFILTVLAIRILLAGMCLIFLLQEIYARIKPGTEEKSWPPYVAFVLALLAALLVLPFALHPYLHLHDAACQFSKWPLHSQALAAVALAAVLIVLSFASRILRSAWGRGWQNIESHPQLFFLALLLIAAFLVPAYLFQYDNTGSWLTGHLLLPRFLNWKAVAFYTFAGLFVFAVQKFLTSAVGALAVYLGADDLSKNFAARSQILHECTTMLIDLLNGEDEKGNKNPVWDYDEVLVAGHSLGSVIAYDALSELIVRNEAPDPTMAGLPLGKIKGLLTFGCPLNKVIYFFRTRTNLQTHVLSQILYMLHPFRLRTPLPPQANPALAIPHPFPEVVPFSPDFKWFNAYSPFDIISGRMQFYRSDAEVAVERGIAPWTAHLSYWENPDLYSLFAHLL